MALFNTLGNIPNKRKSGELGDSEDFPRKKSLWAGASVSHLGGSCWTVQWRNPQAKKHKTWEGDGVLVLDSGTFTLYNSDAKFLGTAKLGLQRPLQPDDEIAVGGKDVFVESPMDISQFRAGVCFSKTQAIAEAASEKDTEEYPKPQAVRRAFVPLQPTNINKTTARSSALPQLQAVTKRQYPPSAAGNRIEIFESFEDDGIPVGDRYKAIAAANLDSSVESLWSVNWRKHTTKKNKTWDGDGMLHQKGNLVRFLSEDGKKVYGSKVVDTVFSQGSKVWIGEKELEIDCKLPLSRLNDRGDMNAPRSQDKESEPGSTFSSTVRKFKAPIMTKQVEEQASVQAKPKPLGPLHDPGAEGAVVMKTPSASHRLRYNPKERPIIPVVLDPLLAKKLRPHQIEGVKFMYECVMAMGKHEGQGCILADAMGLGKTLQTIALIWTLLKQNPYGGNGPVIGKAMIVCPVSLIENWRKEFHKWIGRDRLGVFTGDRDKTAIKQFINSRRDQVLIIGYERLRSVIQELAYCNPPIGLIVCDEGHRLKTAGSKTTKMFEALRTPKRVILSGTPIQNDLGEFHAMSEFCNPGLLDDYATFKKVFESPIVASRAPDCPKKARELGVARAEQLQLLSKSFVLRREATILSNYLPPKFEYVVFVSPSQLQLSMMAKLLNPDALSSLTSSTAKSLALIQTLSKLCNSPYLLTKKDDENSSINAAIRLLPAKAVPEDVSLSGKLTALSNILERLRKETDEKCIVVSHYTSTLNIVESFCTKRKFTYFRLDGQTPAASRQDFVDKFNKSSQGERFLFLLSAKAGGVGLNLIGASRLILIDGDWNPSHDLQAMARIHRDGQRKPVFIYRLLTAGTIDEKIYQRQITKLGLSEAMMGTSTGSSKSKTDSFTHKELRDLFNVYPNAACHTHELLSCPCGSASSTLPSDDDASTNEASAKPRRKFVQDDSDEEEEEERGFVFATQVNPERPSKSEACRRQDALASLSEWTHINCLRPSAASGVQDDVIRSLIHVNNKLPSGPTLAGTGFDEIWDDFEEPLEQQQELMVKDLPGGSITFVFERVSKTGL